MKRKMLDGLLAAHQGAETIFWYLTPMGLEFSDHLAPDLCVYDWMDELSAFRGAPPRLAQMEAKLFRRADIVFTGGQSLYEAERRQHPNVHAFPSSVDREHFVRARDGSQTEPADQAGVGGPRIGYFGVIDERMDVDLIERVATLRPDWNFVMIGPVVKVDPAELPRQPNLHWLGGKTYGELPAYRAGWDAGFMPFALNQSTRFISRPRRPSSFPPACQWSRRRSAMLSARTESSGCPDREGRGGDGRPARDAANPAKANLARRGRPLFVRHLLEQDLVGQRLRRVHRGSEPDIRLLALGEGGVGTLVDRPLLLFRLGRRKNAA